MKFLRLVLRNAVRNKRRAVLTVLSISIAMATISILQTIVVAFNAAVEVADEARLVTRNKTSLVFFLPVAYRERMLKVPGVRSVTAAFWFGGVYQERSNFFAKFAVEPETYFPMYPEYVTPPENYQAFLADRKGCLMGKKLAAKYGFKVGDAIPILGDIFPHPDGGAWDFVVRGIYSGAKPGADETVMFFHYKYLDEALPKRRQGLAGFFILHLEDSSQAGSIVKAVDAEFENGSEQTLTETEKAFQTGFARMMGNIQLLVQAIGSAVVFAILIVAANTMAMSARERTTEIAILKTIGFRPPLLASLVAAEGILLVVAGWAAGTGVAYFVCKGVEKAFPTFFPVFPLKASTAGIALAVALFTGLVSVLFPALHAARTTIADAMRKVA